MKSLKPQVIRKMPNTNGTYNISVEEKKLLDIAKLRNTELYKEQVVYQRNRSIKQFRLQIKQKKREIKYKVAQLETGEVLENHQNFKDGLKPLFYLINDIENLKFEIETLEDNIKKTKEEQEKDVRERKKDV